MDPSRQFHHRIFRQPQQLESQPSTGSSSSYNHNGSSATVAANAASLHLVNASAGNSIEKKHNVEHTNETDANNDISTGEDISNQMSIASIDPFEAYMWNNYYRYTPQFDQGDLSDIYPNDVLYSISNNVACDVIAPTSIGVSTSSPIVIDTSPSVVLVAQHSQPQPRWQESKPSFSSSSSQSPLPSSASTTPASASASASASSRSFKRHDTNKPQISLKRERNRMSARQCRRRSKTKATELEDQADDMQHKHETLLQEIKTLQYELIATQVECMQHIRCRCPEVKQAMSRPSEPAVNSDPASAPPPPPVAALADSLS